MRMTTYFHLAALLAATYNPTAYGSSIQGLRQDMRQLMINRIGGYLPTNDVSEQASLDLDLISMEALVLKRELKHAQRIYVEGGHAMSYAILHVKHHEDVNIPAGTEVSGKNDQGETITGKLMDNLVIKKGINTTVNVMYDRDVANPPYCQVGALRVVSAGSTENCE